jgi:O-acetyl-ADP-ribose deacetylase (regulator of RNase III)
MALQIKNGDLFSGAYAPCIVVHGCNAMGVMESGFAGELRDLIPAAYAAYKRVEMQRGLTLGEISTVEFGDGLVVCNAITQERYGRNPDVVYVDYEAVEAALSAVAVLANERNIPVHLPFIGGGLANGDREKLLAIFQEVFKNVDATLWLN